MECQPLEHQGSPLLRYFKLSYIRMRQTIREGRDFPGGTVVEISLSNAEGAGSKPGWGSEIPHALWPKRKNPEAMLQQVQ